MTPMSYPTIQTTHEITINDEQRLALIVILDYWNECCEASDRPDDDFETDFAVRLNTLLRKAATA
jgi:predicted HicB family RNase H-like nuclease